MHGVKVLLILLVTIGGISDLSSQRKRKLNDGPYISVVNGVKKMMWIEKGKLKNKIISQDTTTFFDVPNLPKVNLTDLGFKKDSTFEYKNVKKFAAISDIHGQHDLFLDILKAQSIIDSLNQWQYGTGHLVILGDVFDRGEKVTETLWFLFELEKQAEAVGGKLHLLLGNHEVMILHGDIGYIHAKYRYTSGVSEIPYSQLYGPQTILGDWLRSKNIAISINDYVFVHGGFSKKVIEKENRLRVLNEIFRKDILPNNEISTESEGLISDLYFNNGPLWYRGYVDTRDFDIDQAYSILNKLNKETIVVGHTSMPQIVSLYDNHIILIDSSIKFGKNGEILLSEDDVLYRGLMNGDRLVLNSENSIENRKSIFDYLFDVSDTATTISIKTDLLHLDSTKMEKAYQSASIIIDDKFDLPTNFDARLKVRGNMRKKICTLPPLKIDFAKSELRSHGFSNMDKLKLVLQCGASEAQANSLKKEHLVYELYRVIDTLGLRTKLIKVALTDGDTVNNIYQGFLLEDEDNLARRINGEIVEKGIVRPQSISRDDYIKMGFFHYMICNKDWSVSGRHNIKTVLLKNAKRLSAIAYDFDYSGIVEQDYSVSNDVFPKADESFRSFKLKDLTKDELETARQYYISIKPVLYKIIDDANYLSQIERKRFKTFINDFYSIILSKRKSKLAFIPVKK